MTMQTMCPYGRFLFHLIPNLCKMEMLAYPCHFRNLVLASANFPS